MVNIDKYILIVCTITRRINEEGKEKELNCERWLYYIFLYDFVD